MEIHVEEVKGIRRASASLRDGEIIFVKVPRHWSKSIKREVITELVGRIERKDAREKALLAKQASRQPRITIHNKQELEAYVRRINAETFNVPLGKIRMGHSRYNHLAQVNLQTKTMTVSKYCLSNVPAEALRYLIVHELAHYFQSGHGPEFWALVARHVPDYRLQSRIMKAFHHQAVIHDGDDVLLEAEKDSITPVEIRPEPDFDPIDFDEPMFEPDFDAPDCLPDCVDNPMPTPPVPVKTGRTTRPRHMEKPSTNHRDKAKSSGPKSGLGWFRQLLLWGDR